MAWDLRGDGRDVIRGGWGIYQDVGYTNSNVLFPAIDAFGAFGDGVQRRQPGRHPQSGRIVLQDQRFARQHRDQNQADPSELPLFGQFLDPRLEMPYTRQTSIGWSHELSQTTVVMVDYVNNQGRDLNTRPRINQFTAPGSGVRRLEFLDLQPNASGTRAASSLARSDYKAMIVGLKRRMTSGFDFTATYTLAEGKSNVGHAVDELNSTTFRTRSLLYDDPRVYGPTSTYGARHSGTDCRGVRS